MNKITHDGKEYEVLPLDRISEITHAKLAGGKVVWAGKLLHPKVVLIESPAAESHRIVKTTFRVEEFEGFGIQPLKLLPKVPVEFVATFAKIGHEWHPVYNLDEGLAQQGRQQKEFRCVEVTEWLKMCYEALSEDWGEDNSVTFEYAFTEELTILIRGTKVKFGAAVTGIELATAWGKHPELVAQAILKAKEVS